MRERFWRTKHLATGNCRRDSMELLRNYSLPPTINQFSLQYLLFVFHNGDNFNNKFRIVIIIIIIIISRNSKVTYIS